MVKPPKRMTKFVINNIAGDKAINLVDELQKKKEKTSEFVLAEKLNLDIKEIRKIFYKLYDSDLVSFSRKKDREKGWYIYYWSFNNDRIKEIFQKLKKTKIDKLKKRLKREEESKFFMCENGCMRLDFDQAMNFNFKCPECGQIIGEEDNSKKIKEIKKEIKTLESEIKKLKKKK